jgi:hypothetical protein
MARNAATAEAEAPAEGSGVDFEDGQSYTFNMKETTEDAGFAPLPKGNYLVTIESVTFGLSKSSQKPMWSLTYAIAEGEFAEKNRKVFDIISLQESQQGRVKRFINRVAPELAEVEEFDPKKVADEGLLVGKQLRVKLDIEEDEQYGARNRVKDHFAPGAAGSGGGSFQM